MVNKKLAKAYGIEAALILSDLITKRQYLDESDMDEGEWFYHTQETIEENTTITPYQQRKAIKTLIEAGFLETKEMGIPSKTYYRVFDNKLLSFFTTGSEVSSQHTLYKENINNNGKILDKTINTPEEVEGVLGGSALEEYRRKKEVVRARKKHSFIPVSGSPRNYQRLPYQKKEKTYFDGRGIR